MTSPYSIKGMKPAYAVELHISVDVSYSLALHVTYHWNEEGRVGVDIVRHQTRQWWPQSTATHSADIASNFIVRSLFTISFSQTHAERTPEPSFAYVPRSAVATVKITG